MRNQLGQTAEAFSSEKEEKHAVKNKGRQDSCCCECALVKRGMGGGGLVSDAFYIELVYYIGPSPH